MQLDRLPSKAHLLTVLNTLENERFFTNFSMIGGTALALQIKHRLSYDFDFVWLKTASLPYQAIRRSIFLIFPSAKEQVNPTSDIEFWEAGLYLQETELNFLIDNTIKITFFVPDNFSEKILKQSDYIQRKSLMLADIDTIFKLKSLLLPQRLKWRDLYDLWYLCKYYNKHPEDIFDTLQKIKGKSLMESALLKLQNMQLKHLGQEFFMYWDEAKPDFVNLSNEIIPFFKKASYTYLSKIAQKYKAPHPVKY